MSSPQFSAEVNAISSNVGRGRKLCKIVSIVERIFSEVWLQNVRNRFRRVQLKITTIKKAPYKTVLISDVERNVSKTLLNNVFKKSVPSCSFAKNRISLGGERRHGQRAAHGRRRERGGRLPGRQGALPHQELERPRFAPRASPDTLAV